MRGGGFLDLSCTCYVVKNVENKVKMFRIKLWGESKYVDKVSEMFFFFSFNIIFRLYSRRACLMAGPNSLPYISHICCNILGSAGCEQRMRCLTAAYQQASAVPEPSAAVLSSQHEGKGLTVQRM